MAAIQNGGFRQRFACLIFLSNVMIIVMLDLFIFQTDQAWICKPVLHEEIFCDSIVMTCNNILIDLVCWFPNVTPPLVMCTVEIATRWRLDKNYGIKMYHFHDGQSMLTL
ncbi:hypothetical protein ACF0H5_017186 [Mactra antiquata]